MQLIFFGLIAGHLLLCLFVVLFIISQPLAPACVRKIPLSAPLQHLVAVSSCHNCSPTQPFDNNGTTIGSLYELLLGNIRFGFIYFASGFHLRKVFRLLALSYPAMDDDNRCVSLISRFDVVILNQKSRVAGWTCTLHSLNLRLSAFKVIKHILYLSSILLLAIGGSGHIKAKFE